LASLDRVFSIAPVADICSSPLWPKSCVSGVGRSAGALGIFPAFDFDAGDDQNSNGAGEDREILAKLIAPIAMEQAQQISDNLIRHFGTLPRVLAAFEGGAPIAFLPANVSNHLRTLKHLISRLLRRDVSRNPILSSTAELLAYLHNEMSHLERETLRVLFLDASNRLIYEEIMWEGTIASVQCHPREIICMALKRSASAVIIVHNHPSGDPSPSASDITVTQELNHAASYLGIIVHDHIIISRGGHVSMRAEGMLDKEQKYAHTAADKNGSDKPIGKLFLTAIVSKLLAFLR
jgi:DNA repair protein RadC